MRRGCLFRKWKICLKSFLMKTLSLDTITFYCRGWFLWASHKTFCTYKIRVEITQYYFYQTLSIYCVYLVSTWWRECWTKTMAKVPSKTYKRSVTVPHSLVYLWPAINQVIQIVVLIHNIYIIVGKIKPSPMLEFQFS